MSPCLARFFKLVLLVGIICLLALGTECTTRPLASKGGNYYINILPPCEP